MLSATENLDKSATHVVARGPFSFFFLFFFFFLNHMFIVSTVQEMTCTFNDMAKTKPKIKSTINQRNKHSHFPQRDQ